MFRALPTALLLAFLGLCSPVVAQNEPRSPPADSFYKDIFPLLRAKCIQCHGPDEQEGDLRLDTRAALLKGGEHGPAISQDDPGKSLLLRAVRHEDENRKMPPDERDRLIELKSTRNGFFVFIFGFVAAMVVVAAGMPPAVMFVTFVCSGVVSDMISTISEFYFYRRGV